MMSNITENEEVIPGYETIKFQNDLEEIMDDMEKTPPLGNYENSLHSGQSSNHIDNIPTIEPTKYDPPRPVTLSTYKSSSTDVTVSTASNGDFIPKPPGPLSTIMTPTSKLESFKAWGMSTYKCTRQYLSEKLGRGNRTVDLDLDGQIEALRDTQRKYANILRLARALSSHFGHVVQTQRTLGEAFGELSQRCSELQDEFSYNSETQRTLVKNGEILLGALNFFTSSVNTLVNKTMDDTVITIKHYETARLEYDAYKADYDSMASTASGTKVTDSKAKVEEHKDKYEKLRNDVFVKLKFLEENKVKVMHKQLLLFHNAVAAYFTGNESALNATLQQFNIKLTSPNASAPSWLEK